MSVFYRLLKGFDLILLDCISFPSRQVPGLCSNRFYSICKFVVILYPSTDTYMSESVAILRMKSLTVYVDHTQQRWVAQQLPYWTYAMGASVWCWRKQIVLRTLWKGQAHTHVSGNNNSVCLMSASMTKENENWAIVALYSTRYHWTGQCTSETMNEKITKLSGGMWHNKNWKQTIAPFCFGPFCNEKQTIAHIYLSQFVGQPPKGWEKKLDFLVHFDIPKLDNNSGQK